MNRPYNLGHQVRKHSIRLLLNASRILLRTQWLRNDETCAFGSLVKCSRREIYRDICLLSSHCSHTLFRIDSPPRLYLYAQRELQTGNNSSNKPPKPIQMSGQDTRIPVKVQFVTSSKSNGTSKSTLRPLHPSPVHYNWHDATQNFVKAVVQEALESNPSGPHSSQRRFAAPHVQAFVTSIREHFAQSEADIMLQTWLCWRREYLFQHSLHSTSPSLTMHRSYEPGKRATNCMHTDKIPKPFSDMTSGRGNNVVSRRMKPDNWIQSLFFLVRHAKQQNDHSSADPSSSKDISFHIQEMYVTYDIFKCFTTLRDQHKWEYVLQLWFDVGYRNPKITLRQPAVRSSKSSLPSSAHIEKKEPKSKPKAYRSDSFYGTIASIVAQSLTAKALYGYATSVIHDALLVGPRATHLNPEVWRMALVSASRVPSSNESERIASDHYLSALVNWALQRIIVAPHPIRRMRALLQEAHWTESLNVFMAGLRRRWWCAGDKKYVVSTMFSQTRHRRWYEGLSILTLYVSAFYTDERKQNAEMSRELDWNKWYQCLSDSELSLYYVQTLTSHPTGALWTQTLYFMFQVLTLPRANVAHWSAMTAGKYPRPIVDRLWYYMPQDVSQRGRRIVSHRIYHALDHGNWKSALAVWLAAPTEVLNSGEILEATYRMLRAVPWSVSSVVSNFTKDTIIHFRRWIEIELYVLSLGYQHAQRNKMYHESVLQQITCRLERIRVLQRLHFTKHFVGDQNDGEIGEETERKRLVPQQVQEWNFVSHSAIRSFHSWDHACLALSIQIEFSLFTTFLHQSAIGDLQKSQWNPQNPLSTSGINRSVLLSAIAIASRQSRQGISAEDKKFNTLDHVLVKCCMADRFVEAQEIFEIMGQLGIEHRSTMFESMRLLRTQFSSPS